ncbi:hypothetical protein QBC39DRAFT_337124 [Podospora conica]|nr:hypothetical protein QBC39DRAFT_337124 [Schizothecium conicum]
MSLTSLTSALQHLTISHPPTSQDSQLTFALEHLTISHPPASQLTIPTTTMAFIRPFEPKDTEACKQICIATLPPSLLAARDPLVRTLAPYLWTLPFTTLSPSTCLVLDDGAGAAVGYCIGCADVYDLERRWPEYVSTVLAREIPAPKQMDELEPWLLPNGEINAAHLVQKAWGVKWLVMEDAKALGGEWRGMMHVDILEGWQGTGWGRKLVHGFLGAVAAACVASPLGEDTVDCGKGVYLGVSPENTKVVGFYERLGWRVWEREEGSEGVTMVRDFWPEGW